MHLRKPSPATIIASLALFFALGGTAIAAHHYLITSTKQIKPSVLKNLKGNAGKTGKTGPAGPAGPSGAAGASGTKGELGPSEVYEVQLKEDSAQQTKNNVRTLKLTGLPAGTYAIYGKAVLKPEEANVGQAECTLIVEPGGANQNDDTAFVPLNTANEELLTLNTELTHTFASTGEAEVNCTTTGDKFKVIYERGEEGTRIIAIRVNTAHTSIAAAS